MNIRILAVGSIKESFYKEAVAEFKKRLTRYASLEIIEVKDEKTVEKACNRRAKVKFYKVFTKISRVGSKRRFQTHIYNRRLYRAL